MERENKLPEAYVLILEEKNGKHTMRGHRKIQ
jgi:hypothetical protein